MVPQEAAAVEAPGPGGRTLRATMVGRPGNEGEHSPMPHVAASVADLLSHLDGIVRIDGDDLQVLDADRLRGEGIRDLA